MSSLYLISSGSCITLSNAVPLSWTRLFISQDVYVYRNPSLWASRDGGATYINIPPGVVAYADGMCQTSGSASVSNVITVVGGRRQSLSGGGVGISYSTYPELTWTEGQVLPTGFSVADMVADSSGEIGILIGNSSSGSAPRIMRSVGGEPFTFVKSDAGIPQSSGSMAIITDIEICE
jgi:hypothetical protein